MPNFATLLGSEQEVSCVLRVDWESSWFMCGRYSFHLTEEEVSELTGSVPQPFPAAVYNQSPGVEVPVLGPEEEWGPMPWGAEMAVGPSRNRLVINARSETAEEKRAFREAFAVRRCVMPASGFFEWHREPPSAQPYYFSPISGPGILLAGLVLLAKPDEKPRVVVLTRGADEWMEAIHHRAPVRIRPDQLRAWLSPERGGAAAVRDCAFPDEEGSLKRHPVSSRVSRVAENDSGILEPVALEPSLLQGDLFL
ncbi:SOS response-associated peptidase [Puniceicoccus vermicola]|uniref:Abasic site processing protein n=1 Tax=Puniceicoccus vermicola TaxID=388746 RepID=A0A7X1AVQ9_9BACT|nr:SOS response-associated peptidase [Puniceicoccus vermicola]MBC2600722.1 SOS response-associated peptidase [Puniceicoccus vermicola]